MKKYSRDVQNGLSEGQDSSPIIRGGEPENLDQNLQLCNWMKRAATSQYLCGRNFILFFWFLFLKWNHS